ncbi:hypothetical protein CLG94_10285 [Candidatus Methylomirabilis limnetica]|uniref:Type I restriction modification DNA specificity domain-containing protein n=1 Tax=Candidatus Methylomirabilis limnetica TaxID=2033718 RepID=A0A2T4TVZ8_9BACT|nr:restriction endonuclease subunit S [Candidatus Methylomirabilis limnetica]PTL35287.1 hypothetical protein CLG94_10285 [Candidatus Methylomirabilis limnetica]
MKLETFFEKFDQFADAPDAVAKMRELILDFAIGGRLLRTSESAELEANGGWPKQTLGSIASLITKGSTPTSYGHQYEASGIPFVKVENIADGVINRSSMEQFISEATHEFLKRSQLESGDILFSIAGTIGKTCVVGSGDVPANTNQALAIIRGFSASFEIPFLKMQLDSFVANKVKAKARGGAMPNVSLGDLRDLLVVVPPLAEQKRIVAKVDELMALCDRLVLQQQERETRHAALARASLARFADAPTPANLPFLFHPSYAIPPADLRKSILTLAVQGLLVPHDPESADWETRKLKELTTKIGSGSTPSGGKESYQESGVPLIRSMNVHFGGFVRHGLAFLNAEQAEKLKNVTVKADDVLLNITGASIGRVATAPKDMEGARVNQHVCILRPSAEIIPPFLELFLASPVVQNLIDDVQVGATREALTKAMIEQFEIPVPSLAEQRRIVAKVEQLMALVDALETQLASSRATAANLLSALVAELTTQT